MTSQARLVFACAVALLFALDSDVLHAQAGRSVGMDSRRAEELYVSDRPEDHDPGRNYARDVALKAQTDSVYRAASLGSFDFRKITYRSSADGMEIPAYIFQPLNLRGRGGHAALIWVHGGVHGNWSAGMLPFVREAVERGYVVIAPEYRGSTGYGRDHHNAIDYGGYEVDDVVTAYDFARENLPHVDPARVAIMGWSHGGFIASHAVFREEHPFRAAVAIVPVTNLIFRLSYKGPRYQRLFSTQERIRGLPFERPELYVERSPVYHVVRLEVPILVHLATNDEDVNFVEAEMFVHALRVKKPELAETKIYVDPPGGHSFSRRVNSALERNDTPEQRDSWNRAWTFLEWNLQPYETASR
ncbi:MAG: S9 family peptidase [Gemmatimonadetes bacterium]|nr:S9 family peptidase [Gemmatimonadota bacterium]